MKKKIRAAVLAAVASVLTVGIVILKRLRSRQMRIRGPHLNREQAREDYLNSILYSGEVK